MTPGKREVRGGVVHRLTTIIDQAVGIIRWIAQPSLAQLMLRLALAVPFWKSGVLKWNGFLQLNDTAIYLFTDEFKLLKSPCFCLRSQAENSHVLHVLPLGDEFREGIAFCRTHEKFGKCLAQRFCHDKLRWGDVGTRGGQHR